MLASVIVQRTNYVRAARLYVGIVLATITVVCLAFLLTGTELPGWLVVAGRWIPALVSLLVLRLVPLPGGVATWWSLRPGGAGRLFAGIGVGVAGLVLVHLATAAGAAALGVARFIDAAVLLAAIPSLLMTLLLISVSTFGEEVAWRGFLQRLWAEHGLWRCAAAVSGVWVVFHVPVHGVMAAQGTLPWPQAIVSTLSLFGMGMFLSAAVARFGSVWPAVFGHAVPLTSLNLLQSPADLPVATLWAVAGVEVALLLVASWLIAPASARVTARSRARS